MTSSKKNATEEDLFFFEAVVAPALAKMRERIAEATPELELDEDALKDLTPEQEVEIYKQILRSRGQNVD
jgi:hypothetical protein